jgi:predicted AlkP superfamily pyrophosphatase or phosphodiesterase
MSKLIFILIDGLRKDTAFAHMGFMEHLLEAGMAARYTVQSELPSLSRPLYEVLMTGTKVIENRIVSNEVRMLSTQQNIFKLARSNRLTTAAAAYCWFSELYNITPFNPVSYRFQNNEELSIQHGIFYFDDPTGSYPDSHLVADAEYLRELFRPDFLLVHPMNVDDAGHKFGGESREYNKAAATIDYVLSNVVPYWLDDGYSILLTADHGMNEYLHGGNSESERMVPMYVISPKVQPGDYSAKPLPQLMIAPFACNLLGIQKGEKMINPVIPGYKEEL